ncbi:MAG TPA: hypothetical protein PKD09_23490 [Aggregatilinea sp.]|uniref:hypothetical protein n=1 Tax=Aggregatilinea sp. TaxID=2806333 RepID=UPI002BC41836|nr:hypothetical protein [Aggregatilinea sp.]HML24637.1 hypothetical protein [Aggregatilinea sp.]
MSKKMLVCFMILAMLLPTLPIYAQSDDSSCFASTDLKFLQDYGYAFADTVDQAGFDAALAGIAGETDVPADIDADGLTFLEALLTDVYYVNIDELGYTYPADKVTAALDGWNASDLPEARQQELAAAVDAGLLDAACAGIDLQADLTADGANYLVYKTLVFTGQYKHYLGASSDDDIYNKVIFAWNSFDQVLMPEFQEPANDLIVEGVITGYNVKRSALNARFDPDLTLVYGHSNINHAIQLIGLLRSEGIVAKVLLEPKTSAYLYLAEWGEPTTSPEFQVEPLDDGNGIAYAKEYDLSLEFESKEEMDRFDSVIKAYAKKNEQDQPGLLLGSWWQPLYSARVELPDYIQVKNNVAIGSEVYIQSFSLAENSETVADAFAQAYPDAEVTTWDLWVNQAFYNYLMGEPG